MICPLRKEYTRVSGDHSDIVEYHYGFCTAGNCAWWNSFKGKCAILSIAEKLEKIK